MMVQRLFIGKEKFLSVFEKPFPVLAWCNSIQTEIFRCNEWVFWNKKHVNSCFNIKMISFTSSESLPLTGPKEFHIDGLSIDCENSRGPCRVSWNSC